MSALPDYVAASPLSVATPKPITCGDVKAAITEAEKAWTQLPASNGAIIYYGAAEVVARIQAAHCAPSVDLTAHWRGAVAPVTRMVLHYLWRIINREMRHGNASMCHKAFGSNVNEYTPAQSAVYKTATVGDPTWAEDNAPDVSALAVAEALALHYHKGGWSGAYGGAKWGVIADVMVAYLRGEMSALMAVDRCWTLQHNTASIFNKGFFWGLDTSALHHVLEAQASGSVIPLVLRLIKGPVACERYRALLAYSGVYSALDASPVSATPSNANPPHAAHGDDTAPLWMGLSTLKKGGRK